MSNSRRRRRWAIPAETQSHIAKIQAAYRCGNLTLYLGAGVSKGNGLPTWAELVLAMYFNAMKDHWEGQWRPYPNYLYAIAEWLLQRRTEPPEITAQKVRQCYKTPKAFLSDLRKCLYGGGDFHPYGPDLCAVNPTLKSVSKLCRGSGIQAVVTYNYDNLLEVATEGSPCEFLPVWKSSAPLDERARAIFHVHGYIPVEGNGSKPEGIVFTEAQFHAAANDPYSWSNLCQIQCMSNSVGLMVGLSLTDPNMRRLLNALKITPLRKPNFALLKKPQWPLPKGSELKAIHQSAGQYQQKLQGSGIKAKMSRNEEMLKIIEIVNQNDHTFHAKMLEELGINPIWFEEYDQLPGILDSIVAA
jgi:SIR2-like domain